MTLPKARAQWRSRSAGRWRRRASSLRVFLTGATGYIGTALASALRSRGHEVGALTRPDDLSTLPSLTGTLGEYDVFIHAAQSQKDKVALDRTAVDVFTSLRKHFIYTSGVWVLGNTKDADESSPANPLPLVAWRPPHEQLVLAAGGAVIRPGCVYGGRQNLLADWFASVDQDKPVKIVGDGRNRWAMVHLSDLTDVYVRAVEQRAAGMLHGIDDTRATLEECANALSDDVRIETIPPQPGPFTDALVVDQQIASTETRRKLGWNPTRTFTSSIDEQWREWRK